MVPQAIKQDRSSDEEDLTEEPEQSINANMPVQHQASFFRRFVLWIAQKLRHFFGY